MMWIPRVSVYDKTTPLLQLRRLVSGIRQRYLVAAVVLIPTLCSCSASKIIDLYAADYRDTAATAGDAQLLLNILRAKDDLPIHFSDLSLIHGSIQWSAGATASFPSGPLHGSSTRDTWSPSVGTQTSPTFDLGTLDTQDFTKGILNPIDPKIVATLFDQGVDTRLMLLLFFSQYRASDGRQYLNNMSCDLAYPKNEDQECRNRSYDYLSKIDHLVKAKGNPPLRANIYVELTPVGGQLAGTWNLKENLKDLSSLDATKYKLINKQLYAISPPRLAICYERNNRLHSLFFASKAGDLLCTQSEIILPARTHSPDQTISLYPRSVYDMIQYLGQVLRFQEEKRSNRCITLDESRTCDSGEVFFQVNAPVGRPVVTTNYGNRHYAIYARDCNKEHEEPCDYSLQVLSIVELLLNANKAAKDIISTPRVQVVP